LTAPFAFSSVSSVTYEEKNTVKRPQQADGIASFRREQEVMIPSEMPSNRSTASKMTAIDSDRYFDLFQWFSAIFRLLADAAERP
jgi:hypothetical protein